MFWFFKLFEAVQITEIRLSIQELHLRYKSSKTHNYISKKRMGNRLADSNQ